MLVGRVRAGLLGAGAMLGAEVSAQLLKPLLAMQRDVPFLEPAAWPSGHTTAVMGFALALAIVAPPRARPYAVAAGALLTVLTVNALADGRLALPERRARRVAAGVGLGVGGRAGAAASATA